MTGIARRAWVTIGRWRGPVAATLGLLLGLTAGGALNWVLDLDDLLDRRHDWQVARFAPVSPELASRTVVVDETSVRLLGGWPLPREAYVPAGRWALAQGARAVVLGLLLVDHRDGDEAFAQWLAMTPQPLLLGARALAGDGDQQPAQAASPGCLPLRVPAWQLPVWARQDQAPPALPVSRVGALSSPLDSDGVLRSLPLWQQAGALALPTMPLAVWRQLHPEAAGGMRCITSGPDRAELQLADGSAWPLDARHRLRPWLARDAAAPPLPLWQLVQAAEGRLPEDQQIALAAAVRGRVVFIGRSAPSTGEAVLTAQGWRDPTALLAASFDALEQQHLLTPPSVPGSLWLLGLLVLPWGAASVVGWRSVRPSPVPVLLAVVLAALLLLGIDLALVARSGQLSHIGWPLASLAVVAGPALALWRRRARQAQASLRRAGDEATAVARAKTEFLAQVSHEVRTPLNALMGAAELLQATPLNDAQRRHVALFTSAGHELLQMLNDLLDLSKSEAGLLKLQRHPFSLTHLVAQQLALFEARAAQKGLVLDTETHPDLPEVVVGDAQRVAQVLRNLLSNAVKFTPVGRVTLAIGFGHGQDRNHDQLHFEVRDTGIGVAAEQLHRLFTPYGQAHEGQPRAYGGTGLGLAISRQLVELMGGHIGVNSRQGLGSVFHFELALPATAAAPRDPVFAASSTRPASDLARLPLHGGGTAVLAADDSVLNLVLLRGFLEAAGYRVDTVVDGAAALRHFERGQYPVVLLDLSMPVMDGFTAAQAMREVESRRQRPRARIIAVSGQVDAHDVASALAAGFDAHVAKPYTRGQLLGAMAGGAADAAAARAVAAEASAANSSWLDAISRLPETDLDEAMQRLGSAQLYGRVLEAARDPLLNFEAHLGRLLAQSPPDVDGAHRLAHNLKSLAATLGLPGLAADARVLERALGDSAYPLHDERLNQARARVLHRLDAVRQALPGSALRGPRQAAGGD